MRRLSSLLALTGIVVASQVAAPAQACACGGVAPPPGAQYGVTGETAAIRWVEPGLEEITMTLALDSSSGDVGLVVPTPTPAEVRAGDSGLFERIVEQIQPLVVVEEDWWGSSSDGVAGGAPPQVLDQVQLGPVEATTLAADDLEGLTTWLTENGYELPAATSAELAPYIDEGWSFAALRLTSDDVLAGDLDPIVLTFESEELVYPMRMARSAEEPQSVRLFVFGDDPAAPVWLGDGGPVPLDATWAGRTTLPELRAQGAYLTVLEGYLDPAAIDGDIVAEAAPGAEDVQPVRYETRPIELLGFPAAPFLIGLGALAVLAALLLVAFRARRRSRSAPEL